MLNVKGRWALVTGAARGIGYGAAVFMAQQGCNLVLHARKAEHLKKVFAENGFTLNTNKTPNPTNLFYEQHEQGKMKIASKDF